MAGRLHHKNIRAAHILLDLNVSLAVAEARDQRLPALQSQKRADLIAQRLIGRTAKDLELIVHPAALRLALRLFVGAHLGLLFGRCRKSCHGSFGSQLLALSKLAAAFPAGSQELKLVSGWAARIRT